MNTPIVLRACFLALLGSSLSSGAAAQAPGPATFPVSISIDASATNGDVHPIWRFFGADEPNYATMKDGRRLIGELGALRPGSVYFRSHNLLNSGDGTAAFKWGSSNAYTEDSKGNPVYNWTITDHIFDTYLARGVRPYLQIGFMPEALSIHPEPYQHEWRPGLSYSGISAGWSYPPRDYAKWSELVYQWTKHCVQKYGKAEVEKWYFEVWNEPNGESYWKSTPEEFQKLHDFAVDAVRRALPTARVGGPDVAGTGGAFMESFLRHVTTGINYATGKTGTPVDFVSFHAKGSPVFVDGHVRMGIAAQLGTIDAGFSMIASVPDLRSKPIVIGESDPEGCAACQGPQNGYRNGTMYASYTAASFARIADIAQRRGVNLDGALTWAFEFEDQPFFAGFRALATNGIDLPVLNIFRMFSMMGGKRLVAHSTGEVALDTMIKTGVRGAPDVAAFASLEGDRLCVMVWHYHDDDLPGAAASVELDISGLGGKITDASLRHFRVDGVHSNSFSQWKVMGSPIAPNDAQYAVLRQAGALSLLESPSKVTVAAGKAFLRFELPRQGVSLIVLDLNGTGAP
ncbi:MAG TPA: beta-xylosidase [Opitutaceae bacterium]|jgi:xylan 1,4-beta-xylosidase|nr:beta-xylosidase [Opitutaceae bacterium]